jgi:hypothetical protein
LKQNHPDVSRSYQSLHETCRLFWRRIDFVAGLATKTLPCVNDVWHLGTVFVAKPDAKKHSFLEEPTYRCKDRWIREKRIEKTLH